MRRAGEAAGLPRELVRRLSVYDLRGSRATAWLDAGASLPQVGYLLGHAAATTTARYVRGTAESAARVVRGAIG